MSKKDEIIKILEKRGSAVVNWEYKSVATEIERLFEKEKVISEFVAEVEKRAEDKMLRTGKLEGAHYAAMTQLLWELRKQKPIKS